MLSTLILHLFGLCAQKRIPHAQHRGRFTEQEAESFNEARLKSKEQKADEDPTRTDE